MTDETRSLHRSSRRYAIALAIVALSPPLILLAAALFQQRVAERVYERVSLYHLPSANVAGEALGNLDRLTRESSPGTTLASRRDAEFQLDASIREVSRLHEEFGRPEYGGHLRRLVDEYDELAATLSLDEIPTETVPATRVAPMSLTLQQIRRLHQIDANASLAEIEYGSSSGLFLVMSILVMGATVVISARILQLLQRNLVQQQQLARMLDDGRTRMAHTQRVEALGRVAGGVAHDFNNLLMGIIGHTEVLRMELDPEAKQMDSVQHILDYAKRAGSITNQLLTYSRKAPSASEILDLNKVISDSESFLQDVVGSAVGIQYDLSPDVGAVPVSATQLQQALTNLALNARDAMPDGGTIMFRTYAEDVLTDITGVGPTEVPYSVVAVQDEGIGMDAGTRALIFDPFFTTKPVGKGTGLGLSMVHGFVTNAGGHIEVESEPGQGSTFLLYLPCADAVPQAREHPRASPEPDKTDRTGDPHTVLVVDDEPGIRSFLRAALESAGLRVMVAANGEQALDLCRRHKDALDLVITDVVMPGLGGVEFVERAQPFLRGARVIFMSGYSSDERLMVTIRDGGHLFLQKPFATSALLELVRAGLPEPTSAPAERTSGNAGSSR